MRTRTMAAGIVVLLCLGAAGRAQDTPPLHHAHGTVEKVEKDALTIRPRGPDGKFEKSLRLTLTGTSKITTASLRKQGKGAVVVQRDTDAKDLAQGQHVAVIYTTGPAGSVLLAAVAQSAPAK